MTYDQEQDAADISELEEELAVALAEVARLREALSRAMDREDNLAVAVTESHDAHDADKRELRRLRAALGWYADASHYQYDAWMHTEVEEDRGERARDALASQPTEKQARDGAENGRN
jgi:hypothetical protein